jgi:hypothetical protein
VLDKFFDAGHYGKNMTQHCPSKADFTVWRRCKNERKLPFSRDDGFKIRHDPYKLRSLLLPYSFKNPHNFLRPFSKLYMA